MPRKKDKPKKLDHLLIDSSEDDAALFRAALDALDPAAIKAKQDREVPAESSAKSSRRKDPATPAHAIDLHHCTLDEACRKIDAIISGLIAGRWSDKTLTPNGHLHLKIITGRGRHSGTQGPVLAREIHRYVLSYYANHIVSIEESPAEALVGGVTVRGHFHVVLRR